MIVKTVQDDIFKTEAKHIAFAINTEGINDSGFAGQVARCYWNELADCGEHEIGTVLSKNVGDKTFHALVCHSLKSDWGENQAAIIQECFDKIPANGEAIATIAIGTGLVGMLSNADFGQIICGMNDSHQQIQLHAGYTLEDIVERFIDNPSEFYIKIANILSAEEREYLREAIQNKNCNNCTNGSCRVESYEKVGLDESGKSQGSNCLSWDNPELLGRQRVLTKHSI